MKIIILDSRGAKERLKGFSWNLRQYYERTGAYKTNTPLLRIEPLDDRRAMQFLLAVAEEWVVSRVNYRRAKTNFYHYAGILTDIPEDELRDLKANGLGLEDTTQLDEYIKTFVDDFFCLEQVDTTVLELQLQMSPHFKDGEWLQWDVAIQDNILVLVRGQDYRISAWEAEHGYEHADLHKSEFSLKPLLRYAAELYVRHHSRPLQIDGATVNPFFELVLFQITELQPNCNLDQFNFDAVNLTALRDHYQASLTPEYLSNLRDVVRIWVNQHLKFRLSPEREYLIESTPQSPVSGAITFRAVDEWTPTSTSLAEKQRYRELKEMAEIQVALNNGDWVPPRERRRLEDYLLHSGEQLLRIIS